MSALQTWTQQHEGLWQFIKFNILSNISTISRFVCSWLGTELLIKGMGFTAPFAFLIFNYTDPSSGGVGAFITFLLAETIAQIVNYIVQKTLVFTGSQTNAGSGVKYAVLAVLIVVVNLVLPGYVTAFCTAQLGLDAGLAALIASVVNTLLAVIVSFPLLKYWIMPTQTEAH